MAIVIGGMQPKPSSRGRHRHSPCLRDVAQAKQGKHQNAKQPTNNTSVSDVNELNSERVVRSIDIYLNALRVV